MNQLLKDSISKKSKKDVKNYVSLVVFSKLFFGRGSKVFYYYIRMFGFIFKNRKYLHQQKLRALNEEYVYIKYRKEFVGLLEKFYDFRYSESFGFYLHK